MGTSTSSCSHCRRHLPRDEGTEHVVEWVTQQTPRRSATDHQIAADHEVEIAHPASVSVIELVIFFPHSGTIAPVWLPCYGER